MADVVDINCDLGESFGAWQMGDDQAIMRYISSANIAAGFHAGDPLVMARAVALANQHAVGVGAHPGFRDLVGFGRRNLEVTSEQARTDVLYQVGALAGFCRRFGVPLQHVKPHGQLNNLCMVDRVLAEAVVAGIRDYDSSLIVVAYGGELAQAALAAGMSVAYEVFADREYHADGTLVSRQSPHAVIHDPTRVVERAIKMVRQHRVQTIEGSWLELKVHTIGVHSDTPGAASLAARLREGLNQAGIRIIAMADIVR